ncbi:hypothetical protein ZEAMMB73_Zm00001d001851 [Zea mays]|uniref:Uncharacterized protein n=1 Tax=Zea mays TaxID=4577 RepID=A0A1D6DTL7_MAIZE|nr:hypothetical protein ZEAMMB73_Zm00001d001851 [Zea mays]
MPLLAPSVAADAPRRRRRLIGRNHMDSPEVVASASPAAAASERQERPARLRRKISSAFCACMGHPLASHTQQ